MPRRPGLPGVLLAALLLCLWASAATAQDADPRLSGVEMEDILDAEVVTASKRNEPLSQVAGAVTVITEEDIRRSGATNIPEALKLAPGVHVARTDTDKWSVGIRGFNSMLNNKHLVLLDGRPITSATRTEVDWSNQSIPLETVKRIEVIRGVWTSLWGSDSFTGVINIITKPASETQGGQSVTLAGTDGLEQSLRLGAADGDLRYRLYAKASYKDGLRIEDPGHHSSSSRNWRQGRGGFRADWSNAFTDELSLQGEVVRSQLDEGGAAMPQIMGPGPRDTTTGYWQLTWDRATGLASGMRFRTSYMRELQSNDDRDGIENTWDAEFQDAMEEIGPHRLTWGMGARYSWDSFENGPDWHLENERSYTLESSAFIQDKIRLVPDRLFLILGSKFDYQGRGALEIQPTARLLHTLDRQEIWLAVSRAVRAANRWQREGSYKIRQGPDEYTIQAPNGLSNEELISYEAGYRRHLSRELSLDVSLFVNDYDRLNGIQVNRATHTGTVTNTLNGTAYGAEALLDWQARDWLTLRPSLSLIRQDFDRISVDGRDFPELEQNTVAEAKLMAMSRLTPDVGFDLSLAYLDSPTEERIPGYFTMDAHASWKVRDGLLLELIGQNLLGAQQEFSLFEVDTSVSLRVTWDF
ncbi:TonB-dependent receptor [Desulfovibrio aminophilus]|uniref:TonB-dependent receptor plug domain-containing protein n=1 Tax=Desulfovibrio aminophilus TaxID=81425 RepID=UPI003396283E